MLLAPNASAEIITRTVIKACLAAEALAEGEAGAATPAAASASE